MLLRLGVCSTLYLVQADGLLVKDLVGRRKMLDHHCRSAKGLRLHSAAYEATIRASKATTTRLAKGVSPLVIVVDLRPTTVPAV